MREEEEVRREGRKAKRAVWRTVVQLSREAEEPPRRRQLRVREEQDEEGM